MQDSSSGSMLVWSGDALHEVTLSNEGKDMWRTYLDYQVSQHKPLLQDLFFARIPVML